MGVDRAVDSEHEGQAQQALPGSQRRGLASRYDKLALTYRGGGVLTSIRIWLRQQRDAS